MIAMERRLIILSGIVQGVGFRAFVHGLASELGLTGFVQNDGERVVMEVEGPPALLEQFRQRLVTEGPRRSRINNVEMQSIEAKASKGFGIQPSR
jgi:hydrogenase maturation protein HypF